MSKYFYHKGDKKFKKRIARIFGGAIFISGLLITGYIFFPFISWQIYFAPAFAYTLETPIPRPEIINPNVVGSLISQAGNLVSGVDYTNAKNWFSYTPSSANKPYVPFFTISIPKLKIQKATVSTTSTDLSKHLVNYPGTAVPAQKGNSVIFGHSTLPQLFNPSDYKTIFATAYLLKVGDTVEANVNGVTYNYKIFNISVVEPDDTSIFTQNLSDSYLTLVTCTPPGTTWKRLIIKAKLEKI